MGNFNKPLKFKSPEELQEKIDKYFTDCDKKKEPYTITGLCLALDITRQTLINYEDCFDNNWLKRLNNDEKAIYVDTVKKAKLKCENYVEKQLLDPYSKKNPAGDIFALKNYGWTDKTEVVTSTKDINITLDNEDKS